MKFDRRNFCNKDAKTGILTQLDETLPMPNKKVAYLYKFNPESYNEMKEKGFRWNLSCDSDMEETGLEWSVGFDMYILGLKGLAQVS